MPVCHYAYKEKNSQLLKQGFSFHKQGITDI